MAVLLYAALTGVIVQLTSAAASGGFTAGHNLPFNAVLIAEALICGAALGSAAARVRGHRP
ncbi:hypothetical protein [Streptomyces collinus]|uniref:hypothetical protein n=1 Tax=Streptomyces collinus TaxID=42684 RepID=UPI0029429F1F|nr:hypothetical protein [Streptomyces collinus]